jgi:2-dehydro-3-deoxygluconokinase
MMNIPGRAFDVVALGEAMVEFNQTTAGQPEYLQGFGGDTSNAVIAAARAGVETAYISRIGQDNFGQLLQQLWLDESVNTSAVEIDSHAPTGIYFVSHSQNGHDFTYRRAGSAASCMSVDWLAQPEVTSVIDQAAIFHVSGITLALSATACEAALAAMGMARRAGATVSFDSNLRLRLWSLEAAQAAITQALKLCDIFLPSLEDITALNGLTEPASIIKWGHSLGAKQVVLKLGADGALVSDGNARQHVPGQRVEAVDATGAGDCFCGNLLARLALGDDVFTATRYANVAAGITVQGHGAVAPLPTMKQVKALL